MAVLEVRITQQEQMDYSGPGRAFPLWVMMKAEDRGVTFKPIKSTHLYLTSEEVYQAIAENWEVFEERRSGDLVIRQWSA